MSIPLSVPLGAERIEAHLKYMQWRTVSVYFVDYPPFYDRNGLYGRDGKDHADNDRRFILYCRSVLEGAKKVGFKPDIVHAHDWQAGLIPAYLERHYGADPFFAGTASVMTVHNMAYQGNFPKESMAAAGFGWEDFTAEGLEYYGKMSFLKAGLVFADRLTTVSPTYAREITESAERGFGMEGLLKRREGELCGILNGLDLDLWNPKRDSSIERRFSAEDSAEGKAACKRALQKEGGLALDAKKPLVGIVSRLDHQKGLDLAIKALEPRLKNLQLVVVGTGDPALQEAFAGLARRNPGAVFLRDAFDDGFARRVYAGADLFLMPSRFEPCGLGQMIAMRYGTPPVASRTGGLADTVSEGVNGFLCAPGDADELGRALDRALEAYAGPDWRQSVRAALETLFPWDKSVELYLETYRRARQRAARPR
ncbi:MAG: glycogen synthase [Elusimicrobia bacterium]|nr:glycogen synthase [Elusimicrobiota bacterium]